MEQKRKSDREKELERFCNNSLINQFFTNKRFSIKKGDLVFSVMERSKPYVFYLD